MVAPVPLRRNRDFLYLWSGQAVSVLGSQTSRVAYPLLVLAITGSAAKAGFASAAATLPYLLFPLLAGAYADRHDRRRIMIACVAGSPWNVAVQTYRLRVVPNHMLARVSSVTFQIAWGAIPLGSLLAAALLGSMSATRAAVIISVALAITAVAATVSASVRGAGATADRGLVPSPKT